MSVLIAIALKSLLIGGLTLGLLHLMRRRSAAERSWVAHVGLLALMIMAFAPLALPSWNVEAPAMLGRTEAPAIAQPAKLEASAAQVPQLAVPVQHEMGVASPPQAQARAQAQPQTGASPIDPVAVATAAYAVPAAILLFITFLALARLVALQARAEVLVDGHWLSALARAQRRMGFKHGTALLTSNELASPISWGLLRPVILLNSRAVEATSEAEAIIAHELAHVARLDWIKLLLARVATALFWFNPLVWMLAREAHQLREETADDTVLAADIADTDYAQLLVGVARHECPGLLLGAHGVAPSKSSLARRVARVLDVGSARGPAARSFALGVLAGAVLVAAPLAALTLTPAASKPSVASAARADSVAPTDVAAAAEPADLPHIIAKGVSTSVTSAVAAATAVAAEPHARATPNFVTTAPSGASVEAKDGTMVTRAASGATVTLYPPDAQGRRKVVAVSPSGATAVTYVDADEKAGAFAWADRHRDHNQRDKSIALRKAGVTPEYIAAMRAAAPRLANVELDDFAGMRGIGVTPEFARAIASAGFPSISADELMEARAVGLSAAYVNAMRSAGVRADLDEFVQLRAVGVSPSFVLRVRASGVRHPDPDTLIEMSALRSVSPKVHVKMHMKDGRSRAHSDADDRAADATAEADSDPDG